ncbi:response regulator [bacterium]|nr:response regulator [bacterium]
MRKRESERILVVDSDTEFRRSLIKTLLRAGYKVSSVSGEVKAKELISMKTYSLILIDPHMHNSSALELLKHVREKSPSSKVIIVSANGGLDMDSKALEAGAFAFLHKPVKRETLLNHIARALKTRGEVAVDGRRIAHV